jgi:hypothetical protein
LTREVASAVVGVHQPGPSLASDHEDNSGDRVDASSGRFVPRTAEIVIRIGVLTPHAAIGPEEEFPAMAPGRLVTRVLRVVDKSVTGGAEGDPPTTPLGLRALTAAPFLDEAARTLAGESVDVVGHASTTSGYVIGFDDETASRCSPVVWKRGRRCSTWRLARVAI